MYRISLALLMFCSTMSLLAAGDDVPPIFKDKCVKCHFVSTLGIETTKKDPSKAKDLANAGNENTDEAELRTYLKKESTRDDEKHKTSFKGTDEEFDQMITWLLSLKK